jgi:hypothetical protein
MQQGLRPAQKLVLLALADRADAHNQAFPSYDRLIFDTGLDRKTIWRALKELAQIGLISDTDERKGKTSSIHVWQLNGVEHRGGSTSSSKNGTAIVDNPHEENAVSENTKQFQKRNDSKNGMVPFLPTSSSKNGITKQFQKRNTESINIEPTKNLKRERCKKPSQTDQNIVTAKNKFLPPSLEEVSEHIALKNLTVNALTFFSHYEANGWMVGRNKMKCWKSALVGWSAREKEKGNGKKKYTMTTEDIYAEF